MRTTEQECVQWLEENRPTIGLKTWGGGSQSTSYFYCKVSDCDCVWPTRFTYIRQSKNPTGCPQCAGKFQITENKAREWLEKNKPTIKLKQYGGNIKAHSIFYCKVDGCGYEWPASFKNIRNTGCSRCSGKEEITEKMAIAWLKNNKPLIKLQTDGWGGSASSKSTFVCMNEQCGCVWKTKFNKIKHSTDCPKCATSKGEQTIAQFLCKHGIEFIEQYSFDGCRYKQPLRFDFYLPDYNVVIEFQGTHHYKQIYYGKTKVNAGNSIETIQIRDQIKRDYCKTNNIKLIEIPYWEYQNIDIILTTLLKL